MEITKVLQVQNYNIWERYQNKVKSYELQNKCSANQMFLWHGTGNTNPELITHSNLGFSTQYVSENKDVKNFWGRAIYFAE